MGCGGACGCSGALEHPLAGQASPVRPERGARTVAISGPLTRPACGCGATTGRLAARGSAPIPSQSSPDRARRGPDAAGARPELARRRLRDASAGVVKQHPGTARREALRPPDSSECGVGARSSGVIRPVPNIAYGRSLRADGRTLLFPGISIQVPPSGNFLSSLDTAMAGLLRVGSKVIRANRSGPNERIGPQDLSGVGTELIRPMLSNSLAAMPSRVTGHAQGLKAAGSASAKAKGAPAPNVGPQGTSSGAGPSGGPSPVATTVAINFRYRQCWLTINLRNGQSFEPVSGACYENAAACSAGFSPGAEGCAGVEWDSYNISVDESRSCYTSQPYGDYRGPTTGCDPRATGGDFEVNLHPVDIAWLGAVVDRIMFIAHMCLDYSAGFRRSDELGDTFRLQAEYLSRYALMLMADQARVIVHEVGHVFLGESHCSDGHNCCFDVAADAWFCRVTARLGLPSAVYNSAVVPGRTDFHLTESVVVDACNGCSRDDARDRYHPTLCDVGAWGVPGQRAVFFSDRCYPVSEAATRCSSISVNEDELLSHTGRLGSGDDVREPQWSK